MVEPMPPIFCPYSKVEKMKILSTFGGKIPDTKILEIISDEVLTSQLGKSLKARSEELGVSVKQLNKIYKHFKVNK